MTELSDLLAACDSLAADTHYAQKTRTLAKALRAWAPTVATPPPPPPPPPPSPSPSPSPATPVPVGALMFSDDFTAPLDTSKWDVKTGAHSNSGTTFATSAVTVANGLLTITATQSAGKWTSGLIQSLAPTYEYSGPRYMEVRAQVPAGFGTWAAPLWEYDAPYGGLGIENDVSEQLGREPGIYHATIHNGTGDANAVGRIITVPTPSTPLSATFHTYGCAMYADHADYYLDGQRSVTIPASDATGWKYVTTPMVCLIGLDMGGSWAGTPTIPGPVRLLVDRVAVWKLA